MDLVVTILIGIGVGPMVELLLPGHTMSELVLAILLGVAGALVGRFVGETAGWLEPDEPASFVAAAVSAIVVLLVYGAVFRPRRKA